ncbi:MAG: hypothetical protein ACUVWY_15045, partial [Desulfosoma sp.]|uniref:hypothetical protein n=1 Tax=Desulfosoma sp. TaxID=2603217 RepID=UPI004048F34E
MGAEEFLIMVWSMTALAAEDRRFGAKKICPQSPSILDKNIRSVKIILLDHLPLNKRPHSISTKTPWARKFNGAP